MFNSKVLTCAVKAFIFTVGAEIKKFLNVIKCFVDGHY